MYILIAICPTQRNYNTHVKGRIWRGSYNDFRAIFFMFFVCTTWLFIILLAAGDYHVYFPRGLHRNYQYLEVFVTHELTPLTYCSVTPVSPSCKRENITFCIPTKWINVKFIYLFIWMLLQLGNLRKLFEFLVLFSWLEPREIKIEGIYCQ